MSPSQPLRLVPFNPDDFSLGEVLVKPSQDKLTTPQAISSALSLYFQWPDNGTCTMSSPPETSNCEIALEYDREDRSPTELWVRYKGRPLKETFQIGERIQVRFEIFRQCYEFTASVLAIGNAEAGFATWDLVITTPEHLLRYRQRRLPRVLLSAQQSQSLPPCIALDSDNTESPPLTILEFGMQAVRVDGLPEAMMHVTRLAFEDRSFPVTCLRREGGQGIFLFTVEEGRQAGLVFDIYRRVAYPNLRPRSEVNLDELVELYSETNYFEKFQTSSNLNDRSTALKEVWRACEEQTHIVTADYVAIDDAAKLVGASSAVLGFWKGASPIWAFHQLCVRTNPNNLELSGHLYMWRAEYLAARPENLEVIGWFDSKSRWLERIYVKFAVQRYGSDCLFPVRVSRHNFRPNSGIENRTPIVKQVIGSQTRYFTQTNNLLAGAHPKYLNASGILDAIIPLAADPSETDVAAVASAICTQAETQEIELEITTRADTEQCKLPLNATPVTDVDRMFLFRKDGLVDLIASVEHSIAVTLRKKHNGALSEAI